MVADPRLIVPATAEVLEGWCGEVLLEWAPEFLDPEEKGADRWVKGPVHPAFGVCCEFSGWHPLTARGFTLHLDLSRAEVRDRVARVVLEAVRADDQRWPSRLPKNTAYDLFALARGWGRCADHRPIFRRYRLDHRDNTRLPDGSLLVDALALAAVYREVCCGR